MHFNTLTEKSQDEQINYSIMDLHFVPGILHQDR